MMALSYHPACAVRSFETHVVAVRYSNEKESHIVYGLDDSSAFRPWVVKEKVAELAVEFRKCRAIKVLYWMEFLQQVKAYPAICSKIFKYDDEQTRRILTSSIYGNTQRVARTLSGRSANARAKNLIVFRCESPAKMVRSDSQIKAENVLSEVLVKKSDSKSDSPSQRSAKVEESHIVVMNPGKAVLVKSQSATAGVGKQARPMIDGSRTQIP